MFIFRLYRLEAYQETLTPMILKILRRITIMVETQELKMIPSEASPDFHTTMIQIILR